ncbi:MAG: hypothetical protein BWY66_01674 [bacterium ADurb.Bin374]|nr:MAG: hypothetical protein BWY66_01674 [bacterium ADurb.Bin374]
MILGRDERERLGRENPVRAFPGDGDGGDAVQVGGGEQQFDIPSGRVGDARSECSGRSRRVENDGIGVRDRYISRIIFELDVHDLVAVTRFQVPGIVRYEGIPGIPNVAIITAPHGLDAVEVIRREIQRDLFRGRPGGPAVDEHRTGRISLVDDDGSAFCTVITLVAGVVRGVGAELVSALVEAGEEERADWRLVRRDEFPGSPGGAGEGADLENVEFETRSGIIRGGAAGNIEVTGIVQRLAESQVARSFRRILVIEHDRLLDDHLSGRNGQGRSA